jgi:gamma-glutamylcyclotransferase (GGCT)/AIG2-like uncharacterized protein YtfP
MHIFKLFIYGTLRSDMTEHHLLAGKFDSMVPAKINARLYARSDDGIPYITVPGKFIALRGSHDYTKDAAALTKFPVQEGYEPNDSIGWVRGELYTLSDYKQVMQIIDLFEDFSPGYESEYDRVLYPVLPEGLEAFEMAWVYVIANNHAEEDDIFVESGFYNPD